MQRKAKIIAKLCRRHFKTMAENLYSKGQTVMTKAGKDKFDRIFKHGKEKDKKRKHNKERLHTKR